MSQIVLIPSTFNSSFRFQKRKRKIRKKLSHVIYHLLGVMCHMSHVTCHMSHVTFSLSPMLRATATGPPLANFPTMHSKLVHQDRTQNPKNSLLRPYSRAQWFWGWDPNQISQQNIISSLTEWNHLNYMGSLRGGCHIPHGRCTCDGKSLLFLVYSLLYQS